MRKLKVVLLLLLAMVVSLLTASAASAKGNPRISTVVIMALGSGEIRIVNDPAFWSSFTLSEFTDGTKGPVTPGSDYAHGYELTRMGDGQDGKLYAIDRIRYFPPGTKEHGYIYVNPFTNNEYSWYGGQWFTTTPAGDDALARWLASSTSTPPNGIPPAYAVGLAVIGLVAGFAAGNTLTRWRRAGNA